MRDTFAKRFVYQILVVIFSVVSGLVSLYFMANREDGVTSIGEVRQGLEWTTMFLWIMVCLLMAHLSPPVDTVRVSVLRLANSISVHEGYLQHYIEKFYLW